MKTFELSEPRNTTVWGLYRQKDRIEMDPLYQREGDLWSREKKQLLIDTIINGFDVPKMYLHKFSLPKEANGGIYDYAVIDGKQRLNAVWGFIDGEFDLGNNIDYIRDQSIDLRGLTYASLATKHPEIKQDFDSWSMDVVAIQTDDLELIEDLFSRLNEAMPLNAAEKRNAYGGPLPVIVRNIAGLPFFTARVPFTNNRYRHYDVAAKMLLASYFDGVVDTKKVYIDQFFDRARHFDQQQIADINNRTVKVLDHMDSVFEDGDPLLRQVGMVIIYYYLFQRASEKGLIADVTREKLAAFDRDRAENRARAADDIALADYDLLEFNRYTQWPNDAVAMKFRLAVMDLKLFDGALGFA